jgi:hypothetical protein
MTGAEACAEQIHKALPKVKAGTLRIWGEWFGSKPHDNWHTIKTCDVYGDRLRLDFDQSEKLLVWSPTAIPRASASKISWTRNEASLSRRILIGTNRNSTLSALSPQWRSFKKRFYCTTVGPGVACVRNSYW